MAQTQCVYLIKDIEEYKIGEIFQFGKKKYIIFGTEYIEGIREGCSEDFNKLSDAKSFIERHYSKGCFYLFGTRYRNFILQFFINKNGNGKFIKKVHVYKNNKWYVTRHVGKYIDLME